MHGTEVLLTEAHDWRDHLLLPLSDFLHLLLEPESEPKATPKKRKAADTTAKSPLKRRNTTAAAATAARSSPKKGKTQSRAKLRRPEEEGAFFSKTEVQWAAISIADQRRFSHIRRIEELEKGTATSHPPCERCALIDETYNVYDEKGRAAFKGGLSYSQCRFNNKPCSLNKTIGKSEAKDKDKKETVAQCLEGVEKELACYKAKSSDLSDSDDEDDE